MSDWFVYIIRASDKRLYTGVTTNVERRFLQHANGRGAKFFSGRTPEAIVYREVFPDQGSALRREAEIKKLSRSEKQRLISGQK